MLGATAPSLQDIHATPTSEAMSGPELNANAIWTALHGYPLPPSPKALDLALIALLALLVPVACLRLVWIAGLGLGVLAGGLYAAAVQLAFDHDIVLPAVYPLVALVVTTAFVLARRARRTLSRYHPFAGWS